MEDVPFALRAKTLRYVHQFGGERVDNRPEVKIGGAASDVARSWLAELWRVEWGGEKMVTRGKVHRLEEADALVAQMGSKLVGAVAFVVDAGSATCELLSLNATVKGQGVGTALLVAVEQAARTKCCHSVCLVTGNDNLDALRFYQRRGYRIAAVHKGAIDEARRAKPTIPVIGEYGIPLHDEIELVKGLGI